MTDQAARSEKASRATRRRLEAQAGVLTARHRARTGPIPDIELFQREACPYSHAVRKKLSALGLDYIAHSVESNPLKHKMLIDVGGRDQIPFLYDRRTGAKIYESTDIIDYLEAEYGQGTPEFFLDRWKSRLGNELKSRRETLKWSILRRRERIDSLLYSTQRTVGWIRRQLRVKPDQQREEEPSEQARAA